MLAAVFKQDSAAGPGAAGPAPSVAVSDSGVGNPTPMRLRAIMATTLMDAPERFEQLIAFITSQLPRPVDEQQCGDGSILFTGGEPSQVIVHLTEHTVVVSEFAGEWEADRLSLTPRLVGELYWHNLPETALMNALSALVRGAREARLSKYRICLVCGGNMPPEYFGAAGVCDRCAKEPPSTIH
jgi:hypothetical protein